MKVQSSGPVSSPSSSIGIMRFFDVESGGPKLTPEFVAGIVVLFVVIEIVLNLLG